MKRPLGIIFDFDGVLADTEWAIYQSWVELYAREGQNLEIETYAPCLGAGYSRWDPAAHLERLTGRSYDWETETPMRQARIESALKTMGLMPGALELMKWCRSQQIGMAVASSSSRRWVEGWLRRFGVLPFFNGVFTRTDGYEVKPSPALFLAAWQSLNLDKEDCLIVEDSENGVLAAWRAQIPCVAIPNRMTEHGDFSCATYRVSCMEELLQSLR